MPNCVNVDVCWTDRVKPVGTLAAAQRQRGAGRLSRGRAFSLRSGRAESSRGVGPPAAEKESPPFFIVKDAVECDGLISNGPGRERTSAKERD